MLPLVSQSSTEAQIHALSLGFFASFAAPFGGFLSSAIKRAYGIKAQFGQPSLFEKDFSLCGMGCKF